MRNILILLSISLMYIACNKNQLEPGDIPENVSLDIDQDASPDFMVVYSKQTEGDPTGNYQSIKMRLESVANGQILKKKNASPIFLDDIELIQSQVTLPLQWEVTNPSSSISFPMAWIRTDYDEITWNDTWSVFSSEEKESYLIGIKLEDNNTTQLAIIEFSVDLQTGEFILIRTTLL